jgi:uncharacterized protein YutE (UPF0331/DUF86 family)
VVLRPEVVRERLVLLEDTVSRLEELAALDAERLRTDFRDGWAVERGLQLAAEILFGVGNHILSAHFGRGARDYEDIIAQLAEAGVISPATAERLRGLGGFRNLLVHGYSRLDPARVLTYLGDAPAHFSAFSRDVRQWLEAGTRAG